MTRPIALVTGASSGIGTAFARRLAADGHDLVLVARDEARLKTLADELHTAHAAESEVLSADLTDADSLATVEARLANPGSPVEILVNNAGYGTFGTFAELPLAGEDGLIRLNILALVRLTHAALEPMLNRRRGAIINVSSVAGFQPGPYEASYAASKAFVTSFTEAVHEEVRTRGVQVMVVCPGFTRTEFQDRAGVDTENVPGALWMDAEQVVDVALRDLRKGSAITVAGAVNKFSAFAVRLAPRVVIRRVAAKAGQRLHS